MTPAAAAILIVFGVFVLTGLGIDPVAAMLVMAASNGAGAIIDARRNRTRPLRSHP